MWLFEDYKPSIYQLISITLWYSMYLSVQENVWNSIKKLALLFWSPLYLKARDIIANGLPELNSVVRLGGFYLLMLSMGLNSTIIAGSVLHDLFATIDIENSVSKLMVLTCIYTKLCMLIYSQMLRSFFLFPLPFFLVLLS